MTPASIKVMDEFGARLKNISVANGYGFDLVKLKRASLQPFAGGDLPAINYWPDEDTFVERHGGSETRHLSVMLQAVTKETDRPLTDAAADLAMDIWVALWRATTTPLVSDQPSPALGGLVSNVTIQSIVPSMASKGDGPMTGVIMNFVVTYRLRSDNLQLIN